MNFREIQQKAKQPFEKQNGEKVGENEKKKKSI